MKYLFPSLVLILLTLCAVGQTSFENGYFVTNDNQRIECLIRNYHWDNNAKEFSYKISDQDESLLKKISDAKEFGIKGSFKFIRAIVDIDQSTDDPATLSTNRNPIWQKDTVYLKVLIEGKASLYSFQDGSLFRYFYNVDSKEINQLIYKRFFVASGVIAANRSFQQQLFNDLKCHGISLSDVTKLDYKESSLTKYFVDYLVCNGDISQLEKVRKTKTKNITAVIGTQLLSRSATGYSVIRIGVEFESILTTRKDWSFFVEPHAYLTSVGSLVFLPFGVRHYFHLNDRAKLFLNLSLLGPYFSLSNSTQLVGFLLLQPLVGGGFAYNRFRIEARIPVSEGLGPLSSITLGYRLFSKK